MAEQGKQAKTTVVRLRRMNGKVVQDCDVYIGRQCTLGGWNLPQSKWHNPYTIKECGTAKEAIAKFENYLERYPDLKACIKTELSGKILGCWCKPNACHGDVLARIANS